MVALTMAIDLLQEDKRTFRTLVDKRYVERSVSCGSRTMPDHISMPSPPAAAFGDNGGHLCPESTTCRSRNVQWTQDAELRRTENS